ncbi:hypothetical protein NHX12_020257, partial [Muraenolepis orangiensis]
MGSEMREREESWVVEEEPGGGTAVSVSVGSRPSGAGSSLSDFSRPGSSAFSRSTDLCSGGRSSALSGDSPGPSWLLPSSPGPPLPPRSPAPPPQTPEEDDHLTAAAAALLQGGRRAQLFIPHRRGSGRDVPPPPLHRPPPALAGPAAHLPVQ